MNTFELNKFAGAFLGTILTILVIGYVGNWLVPKPKVEHAEAAREPKGKAPAAPSAAAPAAPETPIAERLKTAAAADGEKAFAKKCVSCHTADQGGANKVGPNLYNVVGGPKAHVASFNFSDAMKKAGGEWSYDKLDAFLLNPKATVPGTKMTFAGIKDGKERANIILYLRAQSAAPKPLP